MFLECKLFSKSYKLGNYSKMKGQNFQDIDNLIH